MGELEVDRLGTLAPHLDRALDMSDVERAAWLAMLRESDPSLAAELQSLLAGPASGAWDSLLAERLGSIFGRFEARGADSPALPDGPRYEIGDEHARGGMGRILRARDRYLGRTVAIKELLHDVSDAEARFIREAKLTARLEHPSVVPVHDAGRWQASGKLFYSMKLVSGRSLGEVAVAAGSLRERLSLLPNLLAVADAVAYAHSERIIHRDLKPANVLVGAYGETLVVDWGLAKELGGAADEIRVEVGAAAPANDAAAANMTRAGSVLGTPAFMPPEQARGEEVDERADVYALGALLYFVIAAQSPYDGAPAEKLLLRVLAGPPPRLSQREPEAPRDLCAIVEKAMAREPSDRYSAAQELAEDLRRFLSGQMVTARAYSWRQLAERWVRRHRAVAALSSGFLLAALVGTTAFVIREQRLRVEAEASSARADAQSRALLIEHGRRELAQGRPLRASAYLAEAYQHDGSNRALQYLVSEAARSLDAHQGSLRGHERDVKAVAFSPDGTRVATGSSDLTVRLWDARSGQPLAVLRGAALGVRDVAWSPDSRLVASSENIVCVWDAATGSLLHRLAHPGHRLAFSPDGKWLVAASLTGWIWVWDTTSWNVVLEERAHRDRIYAIVFHPDGQRMVTTGWDGVVRFWDVPAWKTSFTLEDHHNPVSTADFSADGRWLLTGDADVTLHVRDAVDGKVLHTLRLPEGSRWMSAFFSPDGRTIVTGTADGMIREWHAASGEMLSSLDALPTGKLFDIALAPNGVDVATVGIAGSDLWRLGGAGSRRIVGDVSHAASGVHPALYSRDNARLVASIELENGARNVLHVWDARSGAALHAWPDIAPGAALAANADLSRVLAAGDDGAAPRLWDTTSGRIIAALDHGGKRVRSVAMNPAGTVLATASDDPSIRFWQADTGRALGAPWTLEVRPTAIAFSPDGGQLAIADDRGRVRLSDVATRGFVRELDAHSSWIESVAYSADGRWLASAGRLDLTAKVWDVSTGALRSTLVGHGDNLVRASLSPDGSLVATASVDNTARLWDAATGELLRVIRGPALSASLSADGRELLTTGMRDYVVIWDVTLDARTPEAIAAQVERQSPWKLEGGRLTLRDAGR